MFWKGTHFPEKNIINLRKFAIIKLLRPNVNIIATQGLAEGTPRRGGEGDKMGVQKVNPTGEEAAST